jgi:hypothetical protein
MVTVMVTVTTTTMHCRPHAVKSMRMNIVLMMRRRQASAAVNVR